MWCGGEKALLLYKRQAGSYVTELRDWRIFASNEMHARAPIDVTASQVAGKIYLHERY